MTKRCFLFNKNSTLSIIMILMIFFSEETLLFGDTPNQMMINIAQAMNFTIIALCVLIRGKKRFKKKRIIHLVILLCALWASFLFNLESESISHYILKTTLLIGAFLIADFFSPKDIIRKTEQIIFFFAVCGLACYIVKIIAPNIINYFPEITGSNGGRYNTLIIASLNRAQYLNSGLYRIQSIFLLITRLYERSPSIAIMKESHASLSITYVSTLNTIPRAWCLCLWAATIVRRKRIY